MPSNKDIREKEILELITKGYSQTQIASTLNVSSATISNWVKKTDQVKLKEAKQARQVRNEAKQQEREKEIIELIAKGYLQVEIAEIMGVAKQTISNWIKEIDEAKLEEAKQQGEKAKREENEVKQQEREQEILELIAKGYSQTQIASMMKVVNSTISNWIKEIDHVKLEEARQKGEEVRQQSGSKSVEKSSKTISKKNNRGKKAGTKNNKLDRIISLVKEKMKQKTITPKDAGVLRQILDEKYNKARYEDIILLLNAYIKTKQITEAIKFINTLINNEDMQYLGTQNLKKIKEQLENIKKIQDVRRLLRQEKNMQEIMGATGLRETEVMKIKKEMEAKLAKGTSR